VPVPGTDADFALAGVRFDGCSAVTSGGAVSASAAKSLWFSCCNFTNNFLDSASSTAVAYAPASVAASASVAAASSSSSSAESGGKEEEREEEQAVMEEEQGNDKDGSLASDEKKGKGGAIFFGDPSVSPRNLLVRLFL
jgi:hypothetical protein